MDLDRVDWANISHLELDLCLQFNQHNDLNLVDKEVCGGLPPLCWACRYNREDLVTVLLHHRADVNKRCFKGQEYPLLYACDHMSGNVGIVRKLLKAGAVVNVADSRGFTALHHASRHGSLPVTKLLVQYGAKVNLKLDGETVLESACWSDTNLGIVDILLKHGANPNLNHGSALNTAIRTKSNKTVNLICASQLVNMKANNFLYNAISYKNLKALKILVDHGADINQGPSYDSMGSTTLHFSSSYDIGIIEILLEYGADPNAINALGRVTLDYICERPDWYWSIRKVKLFLDYRAKVSLLDFQYAFVNNFNSSIKKFTVELLKLLILAGLRLNSNDLTMIGYNVDLHERKNGELLISLVDDYVRQPLTLQCACRITIIKNLKPNVGLNVKHLPLPYQLIEFLNFADLGLNHSKWDKEIE